MPIEIRELQIKVNVNQPQQTNEGQQPSGNNSQAAMHAPQEQLVANAVEQVMDLLRNKNER